MFLYVLKNKGMPSLYKIGVSNDPRARAAALSAMTGVPYPFEVVATVKCSELTDGGYDAETIAHIMLNCYRVNSAREFFRLDDVNHAVHAINLAALCYLSAGCPTGGEWQRLHDELAKWPISGGSAA